jgi:hypothetical protein
MPVVNLSYGMSCLSNEGGSELWTGQAGHTSREGEEQGVPSGDYILGLYVTACLFLPDPPKGLGPGL